MLRSAWDWVAAGVAWLFWYFAPMHVTMVIVFGLCLLDIITGIWASIAEGGKFESRRLRQTLNKIIPFQIALLLAFVSEPYSLAFNIPLIKPISGFVVMIELWSNYENLRRITGIDFWAAVRGKK
jgi:lipopolysaccharide export LptBFGC system permease protein LptF